MTRGDEELTPMSMSRRTCPMVVGLFVAALFGPLGQLYAAEDPLPDMTLVAEPEAPAADAKDPIKPDEKERRVKLTAGLAAIAGILIVGVVLGAVIIIWAGRLRRIVREPIPATGRQDPFWFLRPEKTLLPQDSNEIDTTNSEQG